MKRKLASLLFMLLLPGLAGAQATHTVDGTRLSAALTLRTHQGVDNYLSRSDEYGTPLILKLARQGDIKALLTLTQYAGEGKFLLATDKYGNNLFHVAKNADTVHAVSSLIRHFYGAQAPRRIAALADARNSLNETPLQAQINAAHTDTFRPLYMHTTLKKKNDVARNQLARLQGADERIITQHKAIYCQDIVAAGSANGITLWQAAQAQIPYNPQMRHVSGMIGRVLPCLVQ